ncbi:hypothetical protein VP01_468g1 [Puccinia sorghi]|uniref:Uncharacterized protein n=1 Tax=Puccinia sorghi TaxID=27349 RepID=A0A0L6UNW8_9BASI|nr:hypothetical protein VP01_468g1 [Puccinia sorghi]
MKLYMRKAEADQTNFCWWRRKCGQGIRGGVWFWRFEPALEEDRVDKSCSRGHCRKQHGPAECQGVQRLCSGGPEEWSNWGGAKGSGNQQGFGGAGTSWEQELWGEWQSCGWRVAGVFFFIYLLDLSINLSSTTTKIRGKIGSQASESPKRQNIHSLFPGCKVFRSETKEHLTQIGGGLSTKNREITMLNPPKSPAFTFETSGTLATPQDIPTLAVLNFQLSPLSPLLSFLSLSCNEFLTLIISTCLLRILCFILHHSATTFNLFILIIHIPSQPQFEQLFSTILFCQTTLIHLNKWNQSKNVTETLHCDPLKATSHFKWKEMKTSDREKAWSIYKRFGAYTHFNACSAGINLLNQDQPHYWSLMHGHKSRNLISEMASMAQITPCLLCLNPLDEQLWSINIPPWPPSATCQQSHHYQLPTQKHKLMYTASCSFFLFNTSLSYAIVTYILSQHSLMAMQKQCSTASWKCKGSADTALWLKLLLLLQPFSKSDSTKL